MEQKMLLGLLAVYMLTAIALSFGYLRHRRVMLVETLFWCGVAVIVPVFGPFFVIAARPGPRKHSRRPHPGGG